jgi:hypothetical protein
MSQVNTLHGDQYDEHRLMHTISMKETNYGGYYQPWHPKPPKPGTKLLHQQQSAHDDTFQRHLASQQKRNTVEISEKY